LVLALLRSYVEGEGPTRRVVPSYAVGRDVQGRRVDLVPPGQLACPCLVVRECLLLALDQAEVVLRPERATA